MFVDYNKNLLQVLSSIRKHVGAIPYYDEDKDVSDYLNSKKYEQVIVVLIDAMGSRLIERMLDENSFIRKHMIKEVDTVFPPTTAAATISVQSGKAPNANGWLGWTQYYKEIDDIIVNFYGKGYYSNIDYGSDFANNHNPYLNIIDELGNKGIKARQIYPAFAEDGCKTFKEMVNRIIDESKTKENKYIYCYWDAFDSLMHKVGPNDPSAKKLLEEIDQQLSILPSKLSDSTAVVIIADHGQVDSKHENLYLNKEVSSLLARRPSLEPRAISLWVKEGKNKEFEEVFNKYYKDKFILLTHQEVLDKKIFGEKEEGVRFEEFIGDYVAVATSDLSLGYNDQGDMFVMKGHHAGSCIDEIKIPVILVSKDN